MSTNGLMKYYAGKKHLFHKNREDGSRIIPLNHPHFSFRAIPLFTIQSICVKFSLQLNFLHTLFKKLNLNSQKLSVTWYH
jgi:hypothetical protein